MSNIKYETASPQGSEGDAGAAMAGPPGRIVASRIGEPASERVLRVGGAPTSSSRHAGVGDAELSAQFGSLKAEVDRLHRSLKERDAVPPQVDGPTHGDIKSILDSIQFVEAFLSITLVGKLDEMIGEKQQVVGRIEDARRRARGWLAVSILCNLALVAAILVELRTGVVLPILSSAALAVQTFGVEIGQATGRGAMIAYDRAASLFN